ncbi:MAG TPA: tetratricopeptide repeat protein [Rhodanobacteraceae bacterium]|nr:tetratricopeptide repeat protein [Rhodanobacteraceae bacterium]
MIVDPATQVLDVLFQATALLRAGQHARVQELLGGLIRKQPGCAEAHRLLATSLCQTGDLARAQKELRICLRLRSDDVEAQILLGRTLSATGQAAEALRVLQEASGRDPANVAIACVVARAWLAQGRADEALRRLEAADREAAQGRAEFWMLLGHAQLGLGQPAATADAFREWVRLEPGNHEARMALAAALADAQRATEAEAEIRRCIAAGVRSPGAGFILARALMGQGRLDEAEAHLREVVHVQPGHVTAQGNLAELVWMRSGDAGAACAELDSALRKLPHQHALRIAKARLLYSARQPQAALAEIDAGLALDGKAPALLTTAASIAIDFDGPHALEYATRALAVAPDDRDARVVLGNASLATGRAQVALEIAGALYRSDPCDGQAVAMQADALRMLGDPRYRKLLDFQHLVRAQRIDVPEGWPDLDAYLDDLATSVARSHNLEAHPIGNSLREGSQIPLSPQQSPFAAVRAFPRAIDRPIREYMQAIGNGPDPMRKRNTGRYGLSGMWSVRLRPNGFHVNHYHPQGWISSACYLRLPPAVKQHQGEGWLKFGEPAFPTNPPLEPEYFIRPEPGLLALFPSYMWHGTVPFSGTPDDSRLTIAFDVVPAATPAA